jgi:hypothetical protein
MVSYSHTKTLPYRIRKHCTAGWLVSFVTFNFLPAARGLFLPPVEGAAVCCGEFPSTGAHYGKVQAGRGRAGERFKRR